MCTMRCSALLQPRTAKRGLVGGWAGRTSRCTLWVVAAQRTATNASVPTTPASIKTATEVPGPPTPNLTPSFTSPVAHPACFALGLVVYSCIAIDVFSPDSWHVLQPLDQGLHHAVLANIDPAIRKALFGGVLSNVWIVAGSVGWIFATATALSRKNPVAWGAVSLAWLLWIFGTGKVEHDPLLMDVLKVSFGRARPSPIHRTASFPSGHTAADVLAVGALLFVLLPAVFGCAGNAQRGHKDADPADGNGSWNGDGAGNGRAGGGSGGGAGGLFGALYAAQHSWALWGLSTVTTIVGRVGVDAHWLSDTLAGAALSFSLVSGLALATQQLAENASRPGTGAAGQERDGGV